jgi:hypothetical protein
VRIDTEGNTRIYDSIVSASKDLGVTNSSISCCLRWRNETSSWYRWRYK